MKLTTILASAGGLALLAAILIPTVPYCCPAVETARTRAWLGEVSTALQLYYLEYGVFPSETGNAELIRALQKENPRNLSFYSLGEKMAKNGELIDGWKRPVIFRKTPGGMLLRSAGKDGIHYTPDDVTQEVRVPAPLSRSAS